MRYEPAIDGLRALSVTLVLLFHAQISLFSGGYVGVDVFFVISGYLITRLIQSEHAAGRFSLLKFYERRARRILPAFFLVALTTLAAGVLILLPSELAALGSSTIAATLFVSNYFFWKFEWRNYLLDDTQSMPLLHTWSLAIEEQFYLVFPALTLLALRVSKRYQAVVYFALWCVSLAFCIYLTKRDPRAAFYSSPARAWELLLGALLAVARIKSPLPPPLARILPVAGLAMIALAGVGFDATTPFPGRAALLPCLGAALVIVACSESSPANRLLSHPLLVWVGLISYPLYLWHWPMLIMAKHIVLRELTGAETALLYAAAVGLAAATWKYVEAPIRARPGPFSARSVGLLAASAGCVTIAIGAALHASDGLPTRLPPEALRILAATKDYAPSLGACQNWNRVALAQMPQCVIGAAAKRDFDFALLGDSHAGAIAKALDEAAREVGQKGLQLTSDNCPPALDTQVFVRGAITDCEARNAAALDLLRQHRIRRVILAGQWVQYVYALGPRQDLELRPGGAVAREPLAALQSALGAMVGKLRNAGIDVAIVGPVPVIGWDVPTVLATLEWRHRTARPGPSMTEFMSSQRSIIDMLAALQKDGIPVIFPHEQLCKPDCLVQLDGKILYADQEHLSTQGADLLRPHLMRLLGRAPANP